MWWRVIVLIVGATVAWADDLRWEQREPPPVTGYKLFHNGIIDTWSVAECTPEATPGVNGTPGVWRHVLPTVAPGFTPSFQLQAGNSNPTPSDWSNVKPTGTPVPTNTAVLPSATATVVPSSTPQRPFAPRIL